MKIHELLSALAGAVSGDFSTLSKFNFNGVYIICNCENEVVYIGSAYARTIQTRLSQYLRMNDTGNTLGKTIAKRLAGVETYDKNAKQKITEAVEKIKNFSVYAIKHEDLEYKLINFANPEYNNNGKDED